MVGFADDEKAGVLFMQPAPLICGLTCFA